MGRFARALSHGPVLRLPASQWFGKRNRFVLASVPAGVVTLMVPLDPPGGAIATI
jgi:hypothetical protein